MDESDKSKERATITDASGPETETERADGGKTRKGRLQLKPYHWIVLAIAAYYFVMAGKEMLFPDKGAAQEAAPVSNVPADLALAWSDEFDLDGAPDPSKWDYSLGGNGWGNQELQNYTSDAKNAYVKKGMLHIVARKEDGLWKSARLKTEGKAEWKYGYFEIRAKLPKGIGTWPAIWMLPRYAKYGNWPRSGEIDIMEHVGFDPEVIVTTAHTKAYNHRIGTQKSASRKVEGAQDGFHTYAVDWREDSITWYIDGVEAYRFDNERATTAEWPFDIPFHLIMNVAIGGSWGGQQGVDSRLKTAEMTVDYVRVYQ